MQPNVGNADRVVRIVVGLALLSLVFLVDGTSRWWGLVGLGLLGTALVRRCPAYLPFGISTCRAK